MLFIVPTPIGNLKDITLRALEVLKSVDLIVCEDTRQTQVLLNHYEIKKTLFSFHEHSGPGKVVGIINRLRSGESIALVTDGGTPAISDPGFQIVRSAIENKIPMETLPGACALVTALVGSGLAVDCFTFFGFLSQKSATRRHELEKLAEREETLIFYESPYRVGKALEDMLAVLGDREAVVARELTKKFEEITRGKISELIKKYVGKKVLGEIVILVSGKDRKTLFSV